MAIVGSAEVVVRAITTKVKGDIEKAFRDARASVASEGKSASDDFVRGFKSNFGSGMSDAISDGIGKSNAESDMEDAGKRHGGAFNSGMLDELGNLDVGSVLGDALDGASDDVDKSVTRTAREASNSFESEMGSGGRRGGSAFSKGFENSDFAKGAMKASSAFTQLIGMGNLAGPAIAGLVGALSAAASGLFSMASAAGVAAGALGVLPGLAFAAAQGMGAIKLAFSGIGAAVSAGLKPVSPAVANMASSVNSAQRAVSSALTNLSQAREDAGRRMAQAQKGLARAEQDAARSMADARKGLAEAERSADQAMAEARKNLAQAERDANADLIEARQKLADAEREAARSLVDARNKVVEAENDAAKNIAKARAKLADVYKAGAEKMVDANRKVADASFSLARAQQTLTDSQNKLNDARQEGLEQLQQLAFSAEDAALSEERAGLTLEDAYTNLQKVQNLPPDDRGRREAELAFKEAELGYREAKDRAADVQKEEAKASAAGVEGTSAVVDAKNEQIDAENNLADAQQALADAQVERDKVAVDNAQAVADAKQAIDEARLEGAKKIADAQQDLDDQVYENKRKLADAEANLDKVKYNNAKRIAEARQNLAKTAYDNEKKIADARANIEQTSFDNARRIADARQNIADTARQNARSIADAEQAVTDAQLRLAEAQRKSAAATDVFGAAMSKLSGPAQEFVKYLISLKDEVDALKAAAGQDLFPKLETALRGLVANVFPILEKQLRVTGSLLGDAALGFSHVFNPASGGNRLAEVMRDNNEVLAVFFKRGKDGENTVSDLTRLLLRLLVAVHPVTMVFAEWVKGLIDATEKGTRTGEQMDKLTGFFDKAGRRAALLGDIFKNVFHILGDLAGAADPAGVGLLNSFEDATAALHRFLSTDKQQAKLRAFFHDVANNMRGIGDLINAVGQEFLGLGDNKGIGNLAKSLIPAVHLIGDIGDRLASASPALGGFATEIATLIKRMTQTGQINLFIHVLTQIVHTINNVMTWLGKAANKFDDFFEKLTGIGNVTGKIGKIALEFFAIHRAIAFALVPIAFIFKALAGGPIKVYAQFKKLIKIFGMFRNGDWSKGFRALIGGSDKTILALEKQMTTDKKKIASLDGVAAAADRAAGALERMKVAGEPGVGASTAPVKAPAAAAAAPLASIAPAAAGAGEMAAAEAGAVSAGGKFSKLGGIMGKLIKGPFKLLAGGFKLIGKAVYGVLGPVGLFIAAGVLLFVFFKALYKHSAAFKTFVDAIRDKLKELGDWFHTVMETVIWPALDAFVIKVGEVAQVVGPWLGDMFKRIACFITSVFVPAWNNVLLPTFKGLWTVAKAVFDALVPVFAAFFEGIKWYIVNVAVPYWKLVWKAIQTLWDIAKPIFGFLVAAVKLLFEGIKLYITNVFLPTWGLVWQAIQFLWGIAKPIFGFLIDAVGKLFEGIKFAIQNIFVPMWQLIWQGIQLLWSIAGPIFTLLSTAFGVMSGLIKAAWETILLPAFEGLKSVFQTVADKVSAVVDFIKPKFQEFVDKVTEIVNGIIGQFDAFKDHADDLWDKVNEIIDFVKDKFDDLLDKITDIITRGIKDRFEFWKRIAQELWKKLEEIINWIKDKFEWMRDRIRDVVEIIRQRFENFKDNMEALKNKANQVIDAIKGYFDNVRDKITDVINNHVRPRLEDMKTFLGQLQGKAEDVVNAVRTKFEEMRKKISDVKDDVMGYLGSMKTFFDQLWTKIETVINDSKTKIGEIVTKLDNVKKDIGTAIGDIKDKFGEIATKVTNVFDNLRDNAKHGINLFIDFLNDKLIANINKVTSKFGMKIEKIDRIGSAEGGPVRGDGRDASGRVKGPGGTRADSIPYLLSAGEYVVRGQAVRSIGEQNLNYMNRYGRAPTGLRMGIGDAVDNVAHAAGSVARGIPGIHLHVPDSLEGMYNEGVGKLLKGIVHGAEKLMGAAGIHKDGGLGSFFYGIMDELAKKAGAWGQEKQDAEMARRAAAAAAAAANGGDVGGSIANQVIHAAKATGAGRRDTIIALMTGIVESGLRNLDHGDADSVGVFQQRAPWGSFADRTNVAKSTGKFFHGGTAAGTFGLFHYPQRTQWSMGVAAQTVQRSRYPDRYQQHVGEATALYNNYRPPSSGGGGGEHVGNVSNPAGITSWKGGTFTRLFVASMQAAERLGGFSVHVTQGGFRPTTSYSGSTHNKDAIDSQVNYSLLHAFRAVGIASGDRTGLGNWAPHIHSVPGPGAGYGSPSARRQWEDYLRRGGRGQPARSPWGLAAGGLVPATKGGILAVIGEGGKNERVEPLNKEGLSRRDEAMIKLIQKHAGGGGGGGTTIHVHPSPGMNEIELAELVSRRIAWRRRPGV